MADYLVLVGDGPSGFDNYLNAAEYLEQLAEQGIAEVVHTAMSVGHDENITRSVHRISGEDGLTKKVMALVNNHSVPHSALVARVLDPGRVAQIAKGEGVPQTVSGNYRLSVISSD